MAAVRVLGEAFIRKGPPWARRGGGLALGRLANPPGKVPPQLQRFLFQRGGVPAQCADQTRGMGGVERVLSMNACVSAALGRGGGNGG